MVDTRLRLKRFQEPYLTSCCLINVEYRFKLSHVFSLNYHVPYYVVKVKKHLKNAVKSVEHSESSQEQLIDVQLLQMPM